MNGDVSLFNLALGFVVNTLPALQGSWYCSIVNSSEMQKCLGGKDEMFRNRHLINE